MVIIFTCFVNSLYTLILLVSLLLLLISSTSTSLVSMGSLFSSSYYSSHYHGFVMPHSLFILEIIPPSFILIILLFSMSEGFLFSFSTLFFYSNPILTSLSHFASIFPCLMFLTNIDSLGSPIVAFTFLSLSFLYLQ